MSNTVCIRHDYDSMCKLLKESALTFWILKWELDLSLHVCSLSPCHFIMTFGRWNDKASYITPNFSQGCEWGTKLVGTRQVIAIKKGFQLIRNFASASFSAKFLSYPKIIVALFKKTPWKHPLVYLRAAEFVILSPRCSVNLQNAWCTAIAKGACELRLVNAVRCFKSKLYIETRKLHEESKQVTGI